MMKLDELRQEWADCRRCRLHEERKRVVFGSGSPSARLMFIGEGPGADEDEQGVPFVGMAGHLLTKTIRALGLVRRAIFITNVVACRPPGNRDPFPSESLACWPRLEQTILAIDPACLLIIGRPAAKRLLQRNVQITRERGGTGILPVGDKGYNYVLTIHPSYILRHHGDERDKLEAQFLDDMRQAANFQDMLDNDDVPF